MAAGLDANGSGLLGEVCAASALDEWSEGVVSDAEGGGREHPVDADLQRVDATLHALADQRLGNPGPAGHPEPAEDPDTGDRGDRTAGRAGCMHDPLGAGTDQQRPRSEPAVAAGRRREQRAHLPALWVARRRDEPHAEGSAHRCRFAGES